MRSILGNSGPDRRPVVLARIQLDRDKNLYDIMISLDIHAFGFNI
ncbi:hypothetical protein [Flagellimonas profundi]|nr:hypothetical protein [Allomuricauda profundi]